MAYCQGCADSEKQITAKDSQIRGLREALEKAEVALTVTGLSETVEDARQDALVAIYALRRESPETEGKGAIPARHPMGIIAARYRRAIENTLDSLRGYTPMTPTIEDAINILTGAFDESDSFTMPIEEVHAELREKGINLGPTVERVLTAARKAGAVVEEHNPTPSPEPEPGKGEGFEDFDTWHRRECPEVLYRKKPCDTLGHWLRVDWTAPEGMRTKEQEAALMARFHQKSCREVYAAEHPPSYTPGATSYTKPDDGVTAEHPPANSTGISRTLVEGEGRGEERMARMRSLAELAPTADTLYDWKKGAPVPREAVIEMARQLRHFKMDTLAIQSLRPLPGDEGDRAIIDREIKQAEVWTSDDDGIEYVTLSLPRRIVDRFLARRGGG